ncbi:MAG: family 20 glycosylhydrolase [Anaerolineae bacterium]|nr:family 20 glycosylhydrolase [Anaerolineae bacterium]
MKLWYDPHSIPQDLAVALATLREDYALFGKKTDDAVPLKFSATDKAGQVKVKISEKQAKITYHTVTQACRGIGLLLGLDVAPQDAGSDDKWSEQCPFETMGLMLDCSRNAVMTVAEVKKWLRRMALSGYNMLMLYTEDTYQLPGEPMFGYARGAYTLQEIKDIDEYAARLGIEVIPCIQTLGHLEQILKWGHAYWPVRDTNSVVLVDAEPTYELIAKMLKFWSEAVRSRRVHIGMDETHDLGRGRYMDMFGYKRGFDIFNAHLARVVDLCKTEGLEPMIWSDMYFRMGSKTGGYYDVESQVPADVAAAIPPEAQLVYWDYYHTDEAFYREWIKRHREMGFEPIMGSGVWSWGRFVYSHVYTAQTAQPCVRACLKEGLKEIFFTMWKDDGAAVDFNSTWPGILYAADLAYNGGELSERWRMRFEGVCKADLEANLTIAKMDAAEHYGDEVNTRMLLWDDPLLGLYRRSLLARDSWKDFDLAAYYAGLAQELNALGVKDGAGNLEFAAQLAETLSLKTRVYDQLTQAYTAGDKKTLADLSDRMIPALIAAVKTLWELHRKVWMAQNKAFGFEVQCVRYGGLLLRLEEVAMRVRQYLTGEIAQIEELEIAIAPLPQHFGRYRSVATASSIL